MNKIVSLRDPNPSDLTYLLNLENKFSNQTYSEYPKYYSKQEIKNFISKPQDIFMDFQYRYMIEADNSTVGCIDLFDFDYPYNIALPYAVSRYMFTFLIFSFSERSADLVSDEVSQEPDRYLEELTSCIHSASKVFSLPRFKPLKSWIAENTW